jgi:exosortase
MVLLALVLVGLAVAGLYAATVDWSHPLVDCSLTAAFVCLLAAAWFALAHDGVRWIPANWTAAVAILLWLLCAPIPPGTYTRLTVTLQLWVSEGVLRTLHVLAIPAVRHGNIIELARATVGVEEACSGIRSLISCVFAGLFFSATLVRRPSARAFLVVAAVPLALVMNFLRSLTLTLLANAGVEIAGWWHDLTGFAVLAMTAGILGATALLLGRLDRRAAEVPELGPRRTPRRQFKALLGTMGIAAALIFASAINTRPSVRQNATPPDLLNLLPETAPGWQVSTNNNLYQFSGVLQTDLLAQREYRRQEPDGSFTEIILYAAYWRAGQVPVSLVASHTPDACWIGSGWVAQKTDPPRVTLAIDHHALAPAEYRLFTFNGFPQYVWFWHIYDGRPIQYRDPYSAVELLRIAWKYGFRHNGDQVFIRVSSNRPWAQFAHDALLEEFFRRAAKVGL